MSNLARAFPDLGAIRSRIDQTSTGHRWRTFIDDEYMPEFELDLGVIIEGGAVAVVAVEGFFEAVGQEIAHVFDSNVERNSIDRNAILEAAHLAQTVYAGLLSLRVRQEFGPDGAQPDAGRFEDYAARVFRYTVAIGDAIRSEQFAHVVHDPNTWRDAFQYFITHAGADIENELVGDGLLVAAQVVYPALKGFVTQSAQELGIQFGTLAQIGVAALTYAVLAV